MTGTMVGDNTTNITDSMTGGITNSITDSMTDNTTETHRAIIRDIMMIAENHIISNVVAKMVDGPDKFHRKLKGNVTR